MRNRRSQHQDQVSADHEDSDPQRNHMNHRKRDESGGEKQLICQGVEHGPEPGMLILYSGDRTIQRISESRHEKYNERLIKSAIDK